MKIKKIFLMAGLLFLASCGGSNSSGSSAEGSANAVKPEMLTKANFLTKVADYETNPQTWKYLGDKPAIIDFYASWCGPCKMIAPILEELATEYNGQIRIYKVDVDNEQELAGRFGITSIPALLFVPMEGEPKMIEGAMSKAEFQKKIDQLLLKK